ncbi:hypothetical protein Tco_0087208 [Tanacetum coccineum]
MRGLGEGGGDREDRGEMGGDGVEGEKEVEGGGCRGRWSGDVEDEREGRPRRERCKETLDERQLERGGMGMDGSLGAACGCAAWGGGASEEEEGEKGGDGRMGIESWGERRRWGSRRERREGRWDGGRRSGGVRQEVGEMVGREDGLEGDDGGRGGRVVWEEWGERGERESGALGGDGWDGVGGGRRGGGGGGRGMRGGRRMGGREKEEGLGRRMGWAWERRGDEGWDCGGGRWGWESRDRWGERRGGGEGQRRARVREDEGGGMATGEGIG